MQELYLYVVLRPKQAILHEAPERKTDFVLHLREDLLLSTLDGHLDEEGHSAAVVVDSRAREVGVQVPTEHHNRLAVAALCLNKDVARHTGHVPQVEAHVNLDALHVEEAVRRLPADVEHKQRGKALCRVVVVGLWELFPSRKHDEEPKHTGTMERTHTHTHNVRHGDNFVE